MNRETMGHFAAKFDKSCIVAGVRARTNESLESGTIISFPDPSMYLSLSRENTYFSFETFYNSFANFEV